MELWIRPALPVDRTEIAALHANSWRETYRGALPHAFLDTAIDAEMTDYWAGKFAAVEPGRCLLTALRGEAFAGFLYAYPDPDEPGRDLIESLHVVPGMRSHGVGAALMREAADRLTGLGRSRAILWVFEPNSRARVFYRRLGGVEGEAEPHRIGGAGPVPLVPVAWTGMADLAEAARREANRRLDPPDAVASADIHGAGGAPHPVAAAEHARGRLKQALGDVFGLFDYGVNRVVVAPGVWSTIPHAHSREDEFVFVLEGWATLVTDRGETALGPGDCAGFAAGTGRAHHLENRSEAPVIYLEIGSRHPDRDICRYPGEDLRERLRADGMRGFSRADGTPRD